MTFCRYAVSLVWPLLYVWLALLQVIAYVCG